MPSLTEALAYYEEKLGFQTVTRMPQGDYAIVERDGVVIHLFQAAGGSVSFHIFTEGIEELHDELKARGARISQPIRLKPWGNRDFRVQDVSGNELKFTEPS